MLVLSTLELHTGQEVSGDVYLSLQTGYLSLLLSRLLVLPLPSLLVHALRQHLQSLHPAAGAQLLHPVVLTHVPTAIFALAVCLEQEVAQFLQTHVTIAGLSLVWSPGVPEDVEKVGRGVAGTGMSNEGAHLEYILVIYIDINCQHCPSDCRCLTGGLSRWEGG